MGFFSRLFASKRASESEQPPAPYVPPGDVASQPAVAAPVAPPRKSPPPPPPPPPAEPRPAATGVRAGEPGVPLESIPSEPPAAARPRPRPRAVGHEEVADRSSDEVERPPLQDLEADTRTGWVILEDGTIAYLPGDAELRERMRYLADNLLAPSDEPEEGST